MGSASASTDTTARPASAPCAHPTATTVAAASFRSSSPTKPRRPTPSLGMPLRKSAAFATLAPVALTAPSRNARPAVTSSSARAQLRPRLLRPWSLRLLLRPLQVLPGLLRHQVRVADHPLLNTPFGFYVSFNIS